MHRFFCCVVCSAVVALPVRALLLQNTKPHGEAPTVQTKASRCLDASAWWEAQQKVPYGGGKYSERDQDAKLVSLFDQAHLGTTNKFFVEFGFTGTDNSNSELLRHHFNWTGFVMDDNYEASSWNFVTGKASKRYLGRSYKHAIYPETIESLFKLHEAPVEPDYVSIDIDSADLWVFTNLTRTYRPRVFTIEYSSRIPFDVLYESPTGGSLVSFYKAAERSGYAVVGLEPNLDVFLVRKDLMCAGSEVPAESFRSFAGVTPHQNTPKGHPRKVLWPLPQ